ncbi:UNVERIFIED_CONTAM: cell division protein FtsL [Brevibacillus sp. OAP136]
MSYYYRGNLAVELEPKRNTYKKQQRRIKVRSSLPTKEKLLYLFFISVLVVGVGYIGHRYILISQYNYQIQNLKEDIAKVQESNAATQLKINQMNSRERIYDAALQMGMVSAPDAVHVIGGANVGAPAQSVKSN